MKQGFRENKEIADGLGFDYSSNTASFPSVRLITLQPNRGKRRMALQDISTAFLQSNQYAPGKYKYIRFTSPLGGSVEYFRQSGPIYGEASAPARWEDTIVPWLLEQGFTRNAGDKAVFHHAGRDLNLVLYVDDCLMDGLADDITWFSSLLSTRFKCKEIEWLEPYKPLDYLGVWIIQTDEGVFMTMPKYAQKFVDFVDNNWGKPRRPTRKPKTPLQEEAFTGSEFTLDEDPRHKIQFMAAVGMIGWMATTARPDLQQCHSKLSHYLKGPTVGAYQAIIRVSHYLKSTKWHGLGQKQGEVQCPPLKGTDAKLGFPSNQKGWHFYSDSSHLTFCDASTTLVSQWGGLGMCGTAAVWFASKNSGIAKAHPRLPDGHVDSAVAASEVYAAGNTTREMLYMSYLSEDAGVPYPETAVLQVDNTATIAFAKNSVRSSKMRHIYVRQQWVEDLRNSDLIVTRHVPSLENPADLFTKSLNDVSFVYLRDKFMFDLSSYEDAMEV